MSKRMLIDATHAEETRVAIVDGHKLAEYDYESSSRKPIKGNIYLAKVTRVEPSLQAAFVNFGGNRHGFLPFSEIHPDYFRIPIADREALIAEQEALLAAQEAEMEKEAAEEAAVERGQNGDEDMAADLSEEADDLDGLDDDGDESEEDYVIEEIGGAVASLEGIEGEELLSEAQSAPRGEFSSEGEIWAEGEVSDETPHNLQEGEVEGQPSEEGAQSEGGRDFQRGRGRGRRGRDGRRMNFRNKRSEVVGEEEMSGEERFRMNLRRKYKIQEVIKRGQIMLVQANKEERGNKGAAVGTYLSLPGRYCVLMPNSPRAGGVSRKIANYKDRSRMREIMKELEVPKGMSVIVRTAGVARTKVEIKRDLDYLMRLWDSIRELTLQSSAPALVYEEADLIKRAIRDLYTREVDDIVVAGEAGFKIARNFMKMMVPSHIKKVQMYEENQIPLFTRYQIEMQIQEIGVPTVRLRSGGYLVINPTEALVSIDVNSGKATKERHIEETALKTNLEAADEVARQLRLRDLGGLVVIDFIDMEDRRNNAKVERRLKEALSIDRARVQVGRISSFGLLELSRQRLSPSLTESQYETCSNCKGTGMIRTPEAMSMVVLRAIEEEGIKARAAQITVHVSNAVALYILNNKRKSVVDLESRYGFEVVLLVDEEIPGSEYRLEVSRTLDGVEIAPVEDAASGEGEPSEQEDQSKRTGRDQDRDRDRDRNRGRRGGRGRGREDRNDRNDHQQRPPRDAIFQDENQQPNQGSFESDPEGESEDPDDNIGNRDPQAPRPEGEQPRNRGGRNRRRGGRNRNRGGDRGDRGPRDDSKPREPREPRPPRIESEGPRPSERTNEPRNEGRASNDDVAARLPEAPKPPQPKKEPQSSASYEVVSEPVKEKKRGWWNRLVE